MVNEVIQMQEICFCYVNRKSVKHLWIENGILQEIKLVVLYKELNMWMKYYDTWCKRFQTNQGEGGNTCKHFVMLSNVFPSSDN